MMKWSVTLLFLSIKFWSIILHVVTDTILKYLQLFLRNVIIGFTIRSTFTEIVTLMPFFFVLLLILILFDKLNDILDFLRNHLFFRLFFFVLEVLALWVGHNEPSLEFIRCVFISIFPGMNPLIFHLPKRHLLQSTFFFYRRLLVQNLNIIFDGFSYLPTHKSPFFRCKRNVFLLYRTVIKPVWSFNGVTVWHISQDDGPGSWFFEWCYPEYTTIVTKHVRFCRQ